MEPGVVERRVNDRGRESRGQMLSRPVQYPATRETAVSTGWLGLRSEQLLFRSSVDEDICYVCCCPDGRLES